MNTIKTLLRNKGSDVWSVLPDTSVYDAIHLMAEKEIGALLVMEGQRMVGIISERDYARQVILKGRASDSTPVRDVMSGDVITATRKNSIEDCMGLMTEHRIRHLPIVDGEQVVGVVSVGDLVKAIISDQQSTIHELERYITG